MSEDEPTRKRLPASIRVAILFLLLTAGIFAGVRYWMPPREGGTQVYDNLAVLGARLDNIEKSVVRHEERLSGVESGLQKLAASPPPPTPSPSGTETAPASATLSNAAEERIAALEKQIVSLKTAPAATTAQPQANMADAIRLLSSFHRLSDKVLNGKPFATELSAFEEQDKQEDSSDSPLSQLAPYAESGIPTFATVLAAFDQSMESLNATLGIPPADAGFWERLKYNILHLVSIRRVNETQAGHTAQAITGRAQAHLEREEYEAAIAEIKSLPENLRNNFSSWLDDAQMTTDAPSLISQLEEQVMQKAFHVETPSPAPAPVPPVAPASPVAPPAPEPPPAPQL